MKKLIIALLCAALALSLVGCARDADPTDNSKDGVIGGDSEGGLMQDMKDGAQDVKRDAEIAGRDVKEGVDDAKRDVANDLNTDGRTVEEMQREDLESSRMNYSLGRQPGTVTNDLEQGSGAGTGGGEGDA